VAPSTERATFEALEARLSAESRVCHK